MIVPASLPHAPVLAEIHAAAMILPPPWTVDAFAHQLALPGSFAFLHLSDTQPDGFVLSRAVLDEAEIYAIAVLPDQRRGGIGTALLNRVCDELTARGVRQLFLEVAINNAAAQELYRRNGFAEIGRRANYYGNEDAVVMQRRLI